MCVASHLFFYYINVNFYVLRERAKEEDKKKLCKLIVILYVHRSRAELQKIFFISAFSVCFKLEL